MRIGEKCLGLVIDCMDNCSLNGVFLYCRVLWILGDQFDCTAEVPVI